MTRDYWAVDEILIQEGSINTKFLQAANGLGHLDPLRASLRNRDLPAGSILSLPLWVVSPMTRMGLVEPQLDDSYGSGMQNVLRKGAEGARLGEKSKSYFEVGLCLSWLAGDRQELAAAIFLGVMRRIQFIIERSSLSQSSEDRESEFVHLFTEAEARIYFSGTDANDEYDSWRHGRLGCLRPRAELSSLLKPPTSLN
jgi:hypothetical protein